MSEVIKGVGLNFLPAVLTGDKKKEKTILPGHSPGAFFKKNNVRLRNESIRMCVLEIFDLLLPCIP